MINSKITKGMLGLEIIKRYFEFNYFKKNRLPNFKTKAELITYIKRYYIDEITVVPDDWLELVPREGEKL